MIVKDAEFNDDYESADQEGGLSALDPVLTAMLLDLRKKVSRQLGRPPYVIFQDVSIDQMATDYPITLEELKCIQGVGEGKVKQPYAQEFVDLIKAYCEENEIERQVDMRVRTVAKKSMLKVKIIQSIDRQIALDDIAEAQGIEFEELLDEVEAIVYSGTKLDIGVEFYSHTMTGSPYIDATISDNRQELIAKMQAGKIRGLVVIPVDFAEQMERANAIAPIQVITDGSEPNTANFVQGYVEGIWQIWQMQRAEDNGQTFEPLIDVQTRYWFNPAAISQHFIIPGAVTIIMTVIGAILTSLVVAREWERGTMEALLSTEITRTELLLCKLIPYYFLGMLAMLLCMLVSVFILGVPYRGSLLILFFISSLFLLSTLGMGLLISTITRNQFNAAQVALNAAFLPSIMLSGFIFQIDSMPAVIRAVTYIIPARYFVSTLQSLFLAGNIPVVLIVNVLFLIASAVME